MSHGRERRVSRRAWAARQVAEDLREGAARRELTLFGLRIEHVTERRVLDRIFASLELGRGGWIFTCNLELLRLYATRCDLRPLLSGADMVVADGMPLVWASRIAGDALPERVAGSSLIFPLCGMAALGRRSVYFLGGSPGTAEAAAEILGRRYPGLRVAGTACPPFGFEQRPEAVEGLRAAVRAAQPDIVLVCLGAPKQELLIAELRKDLPRSWFLPLGISFGFVAGEVRRAPLRLQNLGLEWVHRLAQEPGRLTRRYLVHGLPFAGRLALHALRLRWARRTG